VRSWRSLSGTVRRGSPGSSGTTRRPFCDIGRRLGRLRRSFVRLLLGARRETWLDFVFTGSLVARRSLSGA